ncbi:hypothetical protein C0993_006830 [Termitomyces sp. T159_Od127]|nr:hypothetical protein C0993_006830 [Termitomyces sp. T159_Od127]
MKNGNISKYLKDNPQALRLSLAVDVARGLYYLHDKGIIHGDLKGSNVLVDDAGTARVADFGISSISDPQILTLTSHSGAASKGGTVRWQAPELIAMQDDFVMRNGKPSDVYAWACVCYEIFTGRVPLDHLANEAAVMYHVAVKGVRPSPPPSSSPPWKSWGLTVQIWSIMEECWKTEPGDRPTMSFVLDQLHTNALSSETDTQFCPRSFRESMTKVLSKSRFMSTMVLDKLILDHEPAVTTDLVSRREELQRRQGKFEPKLNSHFPGHIQSRVQHVPQFTSLAKQQPTALISRPHCEVVEGVKRPPINSLRSSSIHLPRDGNGRQSEKGATLTNMGHIITRLGAIFNDKIQFKRLLESKGTKAQKFLDAFQTFEILDLSEIASDFRYDVIIAIQELSRRSGLIPTCYMLQDVEIDISASFATKEVLPDLYKGHLLGRTVSLKALRFQSNIKNGPSVKVRDVATGMAYLHDNDIVHGEIKGAR